MTFPHANGRDFRATGRQIRRLAAVSPGDPSGISCSIGRSAGFQNPDRILTFVKGSDATLTACTKASAVRLSSREGGRVADTVSLNGSPTTNGHSGSGAPEMWGGPSAFAEATADRRSLGGGG